MSAKNAKKSRKLQPVPSSPPAFPLPGQNSDEPLTTRPGGPDPSAQALPTRIEGEDLQKLKNVRLEVEIAQERLARFQVLVQSTQDGLERAQEKLQQALQNRSRFEAAIMAKYEADAGTKMNVETGDIIRE
jgi:hypothetical protein